MSLNKILSGITPANKEAQARATAYINTIAIPPWALGRLLDLAVQLAGITGKTQPTVSKKRIFTMAADHGVADEGVSAFPQEVTVQMAGNILLGGAGVNVLGRASGADVQLVDMGVKEDLSALPNADRLKIVKIAAGSENMHKGPAMTREQAEEAILAAYDLVSEAIEKDGVDLLGTGELGIGNSTPAAAILSVLSEQPVEKITGRGTGLDDTGLAHKVKIIEESIALNKPNKDDALDVLAKVGGYDIAGIAGTVLAAAAHHVPVLVDGFISTAGALIAQGLAPAAADYMIPSHRSQEPGHDEMWKLLGKEPLLDLGFRLGEGTGGAVAMHLVQSACDVMNDMLTFEDAGVSTSDTASTEVFED